MSQTIVAMQKPIKPVKFSLPDGYFEEMFYSTGSSQAAEFQASTFLNFLGESFQFLSPELIDMYTGGEEGDEALQADYEELWSSIFGEGSILDGTGFGAGGKNVDFYTTGNDFTIYDEYDTTFDGQAYDELINFTDPSKYFGYDFDLSSYWSGAQSFADNYLSDQNIHAFIQSGNYASLSAEQLFDFMALVTEKTNRITYAMGYLFGSFQYINSPLDNEAMQAQMESVWGQGFLNDLDCHDQYIFGAFLKMMPVVHEYIAALKNPSTGLLLASEQSAYAGFNSHLVDKMETYFEEYIEQFDPSIDVEDRDQAILNQYEDEYRFLQSYLGISSNNYSSLYIDEVNDASFQNQPFLYSLNDVLGSNGAVSWAFYSKNDSTNISDGAFDFDNPYLAYSQIGSLSNAEERALAAAGNWVAIANSYIGNSYEKEITRPMSFSCVYRSQKANYDIKKDKYDAEKEAAELRELQLKKAASMSRAERVKAQKKSEAASQQKRKELLGLSKADQKKQAKRQKSQSKKQPLKA
ncbi:MAG: hypothetical protein KKB81_01765 [Candidatus Margulisbacteria bacterium]|nr:hypothetical protein [Candidatus Margulisiibacteriota bacterium]MBU1021643.1 hypothetical protein [Candidatus Margulisiibacteriota bacterium]MBU1728793.1 hypothetical protein [Candidatus Margulisiibacteriota bacterium]MBU1955759.1 hypothetical protein [Candidatus Margulisiibacteriota bacterium]